MGIGGGQNLIRTFLVATIGSSLLAVSAFAADLPSRRAPPVFEPTPVIPPAFSWSGLEFGLTTSYSFSGSKSISNTPFGGTSGQPYYLSNSKSGLDEVGGGVGYNYQFTPGAGVVIGGMVDVNYFNLKKFLPTVAYGGLGGDEQTRLSYLGTANGRLGYGFDHFLVYATGGFAFAGLHTSAYLYSPGESFPYFGTNGSIATGYDVGGGAEYAIPANSILNYLSVEKLLGLDKKFGLDMLEPTLRVEFIHYDLGSRTVSATNSGGEPGGYLAQFRTAGNVIRFGLGYKFGGTPAAPVVARY